MAKRTKKKQSIHDKEVERLAKEYKKKHWEVEADLRGYPKPSVIGRRRPDLKVKKSGAIRIIEVETSDSIIKDRKQHETFRRHVGQKERTKFYLIETK